MRGERNQEDEEWQHGECEEDLIGDGISDIVCQNEFIHYYNNCPECRCNKG